jgi:hypothetical protein
MPYWAKRRQVSSDEDDSSSYSDSSLDSPSPPRHTCFKRPKSLQGSTQTELRLVESAGVYAFKNRTIGVCYVGKSNNIDSRLAQHREMNPGDVLVREPLLTGGSTNDLESWERNEVLTRMYRNGMESVRGWRFTRRGLLTMEEKISAKNDIMEKFDLCRRCGRNTHFANTCFARTPALWCSEIPME